MALIEIDALPMVYLSKMAGGSFHGKLWMSVVTRFGRHYGPRRRARSVRSPRQLAREWHLGSGSPGLVQGAQGAQEGDEERLDLGIPIGAMLMDLWFHRDWSWDFSWGFIMDWHWSSGFLMGFYPWFISGWWWLEPWNSSWHSIQKREFHHPNWLSLHHFSEGYPLVI